MNISSDSEKFLVSFFRALISYPRALFDVLEDLDPQYVTAEGNPFMSDPEKMKKYHEAIIKQKEEGESGSIIVKL